MTVPLPKLIILDTDPGIDDALALIYLRDRSRVRLLALTTVFGNADIETTTRNALYLRDRFYPEAPVYRGAGAPLQRKRGASPAHVHGRNGLGDIGLGDWAPSQLGDGSAAEQIVELVRAHPGEVTLLAIGPLTNLALALRIAPEIVDLVAEVVVMGGAFGQDGRGGNVTPFAEANIHNDPEAAEMVLAASWPVTLVGLDVTMRCVLSNADAETLAVSGGEAGRFARDISRSYALAYARYEAVDGCCLHDVAAVAFALDATPFVVRRGGIRVCLDDSRLGETRWTAEVGRPSHQACLSVDPSRVVSSFLRALLEPPFNSLTAAADVPSTSP